MRAVTLASLVLLCASGALLSGLDRIQAQTHLPGLPSYKVQNLQDIAFWPDASHADQVLTVWCNRYRASAGHGPLPSTGCTERSTDGKPFKPTVPSPVSMVDRYLAYDLAFIVAYVTLLLILIHRLGVQLKADVPAESRRARNEESRDTRPAIAGLAVAALATIAAGLSDLLEDAGVHALAHDPHSDLGLWSAAIGGALKWGLLAVVVILVVAGIAALAVREPHKRREVLSALHVCRASLILLAVFAFLLLQFADTSNQIADVMRSWDSPIADWPAAYAWGLAVLLGLVLAAGSGLALTAAASTRSLLLQRSRWVFAATAAVLIVWFAVGLWYGEYPYGLLVLAGLLLVAALAIWRLRGRFASAAPRTCIDAARDLLPALMFALPVAAVAVVCIRAAVPKAYVEATSPTWSLFDWPWNGTGGGLVSCGCIALVMAWAGFAILWTWPLPLRPNVVIVAFAFVVAGAFTVTAWADPVSLSLSVGTLAITLAGFMAISLVLILATCLAETLAPPPIFALGLLRRTPVFALLGVWFVGASLVDADGTHQVRVFNTASNDAVVRCQGSAPCRPPTSLARWFDAWIATQAAQRKGGWGVPAAQGSESPKAAAAYPLLLVASEGGGIRAAYWTSLVLNCVLDGIPEGSCGAADPDARPQRRAALFAASGVSGGSVGLAEWTAHLLEKKAPGDWLRSRLDGDHVAPAAAGLMFVDLPNAFLRLHGHDDRAALLEKGLEDGWPDTGVGDLTAPGGLLNVGLFQLNELRFEKGMQLPLLFLNATSVSDGCRISASPVLVGVHPERQPASLGCVSMGDFEPLTNGTAEAAPAADWVLPGTTDTGWMLCRDSGSSTTDIRLSTAAVLSSRFPFVSPSGRLSRDCNRASTAYAVDGGYLENSGASTISDLWRHLGADVEGYNAQHVGKSCIVPLLLQIDNHYNDPRPAGKGARPDELGVPLATVNKTRDGRTDQARQAAALAFSEDIPVFDSGSDSPTYGLVEPGTTKPTRAVRYAYVHPMAHPGVEAPLGWALSPGSVTDLKAELSKNTSQIQRIQSWLSGDSLTCSRS